jgi:hypothetical protein
MRALLEIVERDGRVSARVPVQHWPLTLGRALDNDIVLDDPHVAAHHARLLLDAEGTVSLEVGDTVNGVQVGRQHHGAGSTLALPPAGSWLQMGSARLRLRLPGEMLAPERPLLSASASPWTQPLLAGAALMLLTLAEHWVSLDPGANAESWLGVGVGLPVFVAGWCGIWALASKLFQHRFDFLGHLRIALPWLLAIQLTDMLLTPLAAALGWPGLWRMAGPIQALLGLLMLRSHLMQVLPLSRRTVTAAVALLALLGGAISLTMTQRATDRFSRPAYMSSLPMPPLRWSSPAPAQQLVQQLEPLAAGLAQRVKQARAEEERDGASDGDD